MRGMWRFSVFLALPVALLVAGDARATGGTVAVAGRVIVNGPGGTWLSGVEVCLVETRACVTSGGEGEFSLHAPAHSEVTLTLSKRGHGGVALGLATTGADTRGSVFGMSTDAMLLARKSGVAATHPSDHAGHVVAIASPPDREIGVEGVTLSLQPASGKGPFYAEPDGTFSTKRDRTSSWSAALFTEVAPGEVEIVYGTSMSCVPGFGGWSSKRTNAVRAPVVSGFETRVAMVCKLALRGAAVSASPRGGALASARAARSRRRSGDRSGPGSSTDRPRTPW